MPTAFSNKYYSGQGKFYAADRNALGKPTGFTRLGNVPSMEISVEITKFEHKESESGNRAIDLTIVQEKKGTFTMTLENLSIPNLALAFWGTNSSSSGAAVVDEEVTVYVGFWAPTANPNWNAAITPVVSSRDGATASTWAATTAYALGDYVVDVAAGGRYWKATTAGTSAGSEPTWTTTAGATVVDGTVTWTDMGLIAKTVATDGTANITYDPVHGTLYAEDDGDTYSGEVMEVDYTHKGYIYMDAFTETSQEKWLRFEGLNTVDELPVTIDMYKASLDPLTGYQLINEEIGSLEISGNLLLDELQPVGQQLFRQVSHVDTV